MSFFDTLNVSASALTAQRVRMDILSENMANAETTRTESGGPYKKKMVLFDERVDSGISFESALWKAQGNAPYGKGVRVSQIIQDETLGPLIYEPSHPDADEAGYVRKPNINIVEEMVNMISASRSYEANVTAMNITKGMISRTLEIGRQ